MLPNAPQLPRIWNEAELEDEANKALQTFVDRRLAEPETRHAEHLKARQNSVQALFRALSPLDPAQPDPDIIQKILLDDELQAALRYVAGPPISDDDLGVVVTRAPKRLTRRDIGLQPDLAVKILKLVCHIADASRFPWIREARKPLDREIRMAIRSTAALHATQSVQTERRGYGHKSNGCSEIGSWQKDFCARRCLMAAGSMRPSTFRHPDHSTVNVRSMAAARTC